MDTPVEVLTSAQSSSADTSQASRVHVPLPLEQTAASPQRISDALARSEERLQLGHFDDALRVLEPFRDQQDLSPADAVDIERAKARVYTARGYPLLAREALTNAFEGVHQQLDSLTKLQLSVHLAYVNFVGCGDPVADQSLLQKAQDILDKQDIDGYDHPSVEMQAHLDKISIVRQVLNRLEHNDCLPEISTRLKPLINHFRKLQKYRELWMASIAYLQTMSKPEAESWLEETLADTELPKWIYAEFSLELAKANIEASLKSAAAEWLTKADDAYREVGHAFGMDEIRRLRLHHSIEESLNPLQDFVKITVRYVETNHPMAALRSAISPLALASKGGHAGVYINLQEYFHDLSNRAGLKLTRLLLELQLLAELHAGTGHNATVTQLGQSLYEECISLEYWTQAYMAGTILSLAYTQRGDDQEALKIAETLYEMCRRERLLARSEAAYHLAMHQTFKHLPNTDDSIANCLEVSKFLLPTVEADIEAQKTKLACQKLVLVVRLQFDVARHSEDKYPQLKREALLTIDRIRALTSALEDIDKVLIEGNCTNLMFTQLFFEGSKRDDHVKELEGIDISTKLIESYQKHDLKVYAANTHIVRGLFHQCLHDKEADLSKKGDRLVEAEKDLHTASVLPEAVGSWQQALVSRHTRTRIHVRAWHLYGIPAEYVMGSLQQLETVADHQRRDLSMFGSLTALLEKQKFSRTSQIRDLYEWAATVSTRCGMKENLLIWSQKRKARSLSEMLGLGVLMPKSARQAVEGDPSTASAFDKLETLRFAFQNAPPNEKVYLMQRVEDCEAIVRKSPAFDDFIALRDGVVKRIDELGDLKAASDAANDGCTDPQQQRSLIFADWIVCNDILYLVTVDASSPTTTCQMHRLDPRMSDIRAWMAEYFQSDRLRKDCLQRDSFRDSSKPLRELDGLITPLASVSKKGDLLLLSSTSDLFSLPLHALGIDMDNKRVPLIERNPVVYAPSLPFARICASRASQECTSREALFFGVFDKETEAKRIYEQMKTLAATMGGQSICDSDATKERYMASAPKARLIHHHLHCVSSVDNMLKQSIVLSPPSQQPITTAPKDGGGGLQVDTVTNDNLDTSSRASQILLALERATANLDDELLLNSDSSESNSHLNVEEVFRLALQSSLVVLVACESASQTIREGDEPLGLITGYLCAGAASVIGASWPIPSGTGRKFSENFYGEAMKSKSALINLALALQEAVLKVRDDPDTSSTYHWGAFCLYGAWLFRPPWSDERNEHPPAQ